MLELTPQQRRELRAKAHHLDPVVSVGQHGLTPQVMHEIDVALAAHELVKVRVHDDDRAHREAMLARIADELAAAPVQHLGKLLILWRPAPPEQPKHAVAKKPPRKRSPANVAPRARQPRQAATAGSRRGRGSERARAEASPAGARRRRRGAEDGAGEARTKTEPRSTPRPARDGAPLESRKRRVANDAAPAAPVRRRRRRS